QNQNSPSTLPTNNEPINNEIPSPKQEQTPTQKIKENLTQAQTGTPEEKKQALKSLENQETEKGYNENKEEIENLKKEQATENPEKYSEEVQQRIAEKLAANKVKEEELNEENQQAFQKLKKGEIKDPEQLVVAETKIKTNIYQK